MEAITRSISSCLTLVVEKRVPQAMALPMEEGLKLLICRRVKLIKSKYDIIPDMTHINLLPQK